MGSSSFRIVKVAPGYFWGLMRTISRVWRGRREFSTKLAKAPAASEVTHGSR
jgi:hypothetical protein